MMNHLQLFAVTLSGPQLLGIPADATGFDDLYHGLTLGVYSAFRTFEHNKFLWLEHHIERTIRSMELLDWSYTLDEQGLRHALHQVCSTHPASDMRVRIDVLAEPAYNLGTESRLLIGLMPLTPIPQELYQTGVTVGFAEGLSRDNPLIKTADFAKARQSFTTGSVHMYERLMVDEQGHILEGMSSNFYGVLDGGFCTAGSGVLEGITRKIILDLVKELAIPLRLEPIHLSEIHHLSEAAISSSSRALLPVVNISGTQIGDGTSGPICQQILAAYHDFVQSEIKTAI